MKTFSFKNSMSDVFSMDKKIEKYKNSTNEETISVNAYDHKIVTSFIKVWATNFF